MRKKLLLSARIFRTESYLVLRVLEEMDEFDIYAQSAKLSAVQFKNVYLINFFWLYYNKEFLSVM